MFLDVGPVSVIALIHKETNVYEKSGSDDNFFVAYTPGGGEPSKKFNVFSLKSNFIVLQNKLRTDVKHLVARGFK